MILLIAKNTVQEGKQQEFVELAKKMIENTRQEEGCIYYDLVADQNDEQVYFFIEKQPINYAGSANGIDLQPVSEEGANTPVNTGGGISAYISDTRWKTMSHMYYWAQAFKKLYPNEMEIYYETDDFVCYKLHQNVECLYNLAIDYGYNNPQEQEEK